MCLEMCYFIFFTSLVSILHYLVLSVRKQAQGVQHLSQGHVINKLESSGLNPTVSDSAFLHIHLTSCCLYLKIDDFEWFPKSCRFFWGHSRSKDQVNISLNAWYLNVSKQRWWRTFTGSKVLAPVLVLLLTMCPGVGLSLLEYNHWFVWLISQ